MLKVLVSLILILLVGFQYLSQTSDLNLTLEQEQVEQYKEWKMKYKGVSNSEDFDQYRYYVWLDNLKFVESFMNNRNHGDTLELEMNKFADLTNEEFKDLYISNYKSGSTQQQAKKVQNQQLQDNQTVQIDWRDYGAVGRVQNQRQCKASYAFAAVDNAQSIYYLKSGDYKYFSEQQIIDCDSDVNLTCAGEGNVKNALDYIVEKGLFQQYLYPYVAQRKACQYDAIKKKGNGPITPFTDVLEVEKGDCNDLLAKLQKNPVVVEVDASSQEFQLYKGGIFRLCGNLGSHNMLLTGVYKLADDSTGYWTVKNSMGKDWGEQGFMRIFYGDTCAICNNAKTGSK